jgi:hypothetical protein
VLEKKMHRARYLKNDKKWKSCLRIKITEINFGHTNAVSNLLVGLAV